MTGLSINLNEVQENLQVIETQIRDTQLLQDSEGNPSGTAGQVKVMSMLQQVLGQLNPELTQENGSSFESKLQQALENPVASSFAKEGVEAEDSAQSAAPVITSNRSAAPQVSYEALEMAIGIAAAAISTTTTNVGLTSAAITSDGASNGAGMETVYKTTENRAIKELNNLLNESGWEKIWHAIEKPFADIFTACMLISALASQQYEVVGAIVASLVMAHYAPAIASAVAADCVNNGMSQEKADEVGASVAAACVVLAAIAGGQIGKACGTLTEEIAPEMTKLTEEVVKGVDREAIENIAADDVDDLIQGDHQQTPPSDAPHGEDLDVTGVGSGSPVSVADQNIEELEQITEEVVIQQPQEKRLYETFKEILSKVGSGIMKINPFNYLPTSVNTALYGLAKGVSSSHLTSSVLNAIDYQNSSKERTDKTAVYATMEFLNLFINVGTMISFAGNMSPKGNINATLFRVLEGTKLVAGIGMATAELGEAVPNGITAKLTEQYASTQAQLKSAGYVLDMISKTNQNEINTANKMITNLFQILNGLVNAPGNAFQALAQEMA